MAEKELAIILRAKDLASRTIAGVRKEVGTLGKVGTRAMQGLTTAITRVGLAATVGLVGAIGMGVRSLADLQRTEAQTAAVIKSTGNAAGQTTASIRKHAQELENLSTVDDKVIQDGQNMLLTFTNISGDTFPRATKATLNLAVAMAKGDASQVDMKASAIQVGKALNDPIKGVTALRKVGVAFTEQQVKQIKTLVKSGKTVEAQTIILKELEVEFGNAAKAAGTGPAAVWRRLQDVGEDLSQVLARGLLPVLERAGTWLSTKLADPAVVATIDEIGQGLGRAASEAMDFIEAIDFKAIGDGLRTAAGFAKGVVSAFMGMPDWVKTAVITGWGLNKLTGGAVGSIVGELGKGLIRGVLGMNAGVVNINAGVVNGAGGIPGVAGAGAGAAGGIGLGAGLAGIAAGVAVSALAIMGLGELSNALSTPEQKAAYKQNVIDQNLLKRRPPSIVPPPKATPTRPGMFGGRSPDEREGRRIAGEAAVLERATAKGLKPSADQITRTYNATAARQMAAAQVQMAAAQRAAFATEQGTNRIVAAIKGISQPTVNVYNSAADNIRTQVRRRRIVKPSGSRGSLVGGPQEF